MNMLSYINPLSTFIRLLLAVVMGGVIGIERGYKGRPAGMRTYMLVCLASALVMITSQYIVDYHYGTDASRMGAQVISGIGFLGAGTIIITRDRQVRGLTTAAGLWAAACLGLAVGAGFYIGALMGTGFIIFITSVMHNMDTFLATRSRFMVIYVEMPGGTPAQRLLNDMRALHIGINNMEMMQPKYDAKDHTAVLLSLHLPPRMVRFELLAGIHALEYVNYVEEI